jgi:UDP-glucose 4-epimerase
MAIYLITGGAGFIGSNIVAQLVNDDQKVRVLDNFATGRRENLYPFMNKIELIEGNLTDLETVREATLGVDFVLHQGALPSITRSIEHPIDSNNTNICGTLNVLIASKDSKVKRVIYASSSSVYGDSSVLPRVEKMNPNPISPYAVSKLAGEFYCKAFHRIYGLEVVILRYFNVFGINQNPYSTYSSVIPRFISAILKKSSPTIFGDGLQSRDFTFVSNVVRANLQALKSDRAVGEIINIGSGMNYSLLQLVDKINSILKTDIQPRFTSPRQGEIKHSLAAIDKAERLLDYTPEVGLKEGLEKMISWLNENEQKSKNI